MNLNVLLQKAVVGEFLSLDEGLFLYEKAPTSELMFAAHTIRTKQQPDRATQVGWMIDRNVNITNICVSQCKFCNFCRTPKHTEAYTTPIDQYIEKIEYLFKCGGNQLLLQGGMNPQLGLEYYTQLFSTLKHLFPALKLHALGPPEVVFLAKMEKLDFKQTLIRLMEAGLDSLPGAGAEILSDRVRKIISPAKCSVAEWLDVMREAHKLNLLTSATMMFGHVETNIERIEHLVKIREVQAEKSEDATGFIAFIPWTFQHVGTRLVREMDAPPYISTDEYLRTIAISRIMLPNIKNIQASWLTVGKQTAQLSLHGGANDFGSIMIEENVVASAGANNHFDAQGIQQAISEAGFIPKLRNQQYQYQEYTQK